MWNCNEIARRCPLPHYHNNGCVGMVLQWWHLLPVEACCECSFHSVAKCCHIQLVGVFEYSNEEKSWTLCTKCTKNIFQEWSCVAKCVDVQRLDRRSGLSDLGLSHLRSTVQNASFCRRVPEKYPHKLMICMTFVQCQSSQCQKAILQGRGEGGSELKTPDGLFP